MDKLSSPKVVVAVTHSRLRIDKIDAILSNRTKYDEEQYLVQWKSESPNYPPLSWHSLRELDRCLDFVQDYLESRAKDLAGSEDLENTRKRKILDTDAETAQRRVSPFERRLYDTSRTPSASRASSTSSSDDLAREMPRKLPTFSPRTIDMYNGAMEYEDGFKYVKCAVGLKVPRIDVKHIPTQTMKQTARVSSVRHGASRIRKEYLRRLKEVPGKPIHLVNTYDTSTPSLRFRYISDYVLREGVYKLDPASQVGCQKCSEAMGRGIGCEYTQKCDCLEYAAVNEKKLDAEEARRYKKIKANGGSTIGFPKRFPYFAPTASSKKRMTLNHFYLDSRNAIYECNDNCRCGPMCRNKNVQFGRTVELEIFHCGGDGGRTRGWGLRCLTDLVRGQFVDTYRGEIITDAEATRREESGSKAKASYLYSLDKFQESEGIPPENVYVVDGEFMGGPTKFINHSCDPNCRIYTVSYNKHDSHVYDLAFFACRYIPAGEELTFDYVDRDEDAGAEENEEPGEGAVPCLCGADKCRKWLWT